MCVVCFLGVGRLPYMYHLCGPSTRSYAKTMPRTRHSNPRSSTFQPLRKRSQYRGLDTCSIYPLVRPYVKQPIMNCRWTAIVVPLAKLAILVNTFPRTLFWVIKPLHSPSSLDRKALNWDAQYPRRTTKIWEYDIRVRPRKDTWRLSGLLLRMMPPTSATGLARCKPWCRTCRCYDIESFITWVGAE